MGINFCAAEFLELQGAARMVSVAVCQQNACNLFKSKAFHVLIHNLSIVSGVDHRDLIRAFSVHIITISLAGTQYPSLYF